jgi:2-dehydro-3-deoxy-D-arabinonate dehydratase
MRLYKTRHAIVLERDGMFYTLDSQDWDAFVNDDLLSDKMTDASQTMKPDDRAEHLIKTELRAPIQSQEIWASGVTYARSKVERQKESKKAGGGDFYAGVYEAERPELFFKANGHRAVGSGGKVRIRGDSTWNVPEPELTLVITSSGNIVGYTIGNDMSSRSIEGENPLYLPQAKTYDGSAAVGPCVYVTEEPLPVETAIKMQIRRRGASVFEGEVAISQMKRSMQELVTYLFREYSFPWGCLLMTGTGIIPPGDFTLQHNDEIRITIDTIGTLINLVE